MVIVMVFNVLWLTAVAAAAALAGFCMGRLSVGAGEGSPEEGMSDRSVRRRDTWEVEAAGGGNVRVDAGTFEKDSDGQWVRMAERAGRMSVAERPAGSVGIRSGRIWTGTAKGTDTEPEREKTHPGSARQWSGSFGLRSHSVNSRSLRAGMKFHGPREPQEPLGQTWQVGSPVSGVVVSYREGERPAVVISPLEDKLYAPANGKITRLFPLGNAFLFRTEFGAELYIRAGDATDDLLGRYFRPRVVQNEIVGKGKLLLEFDRLGLRAEGASFAVTLSVENHAYGNSITMTAEERVKPGEEILRVTEA